MSPALKQEVDRAIREWLTTPAGAPGYVERQQARVDLMARMQIEYSEQKEAERMARKPGTTKKQTTQAAALLTALDFVSVATSNEAHLGTAAKHVSLSGNFAVAFDGQLAAGHPIAEELTLCPQVEQLTKALKRSGKTLAIAETPSGRLSIKGEKLQAYVPCLRPEDMAQAYPDPRCAVVDDRIKAAFACCGTMASENGTWVHEASLLLRANDCTGTNGAAILQFWHGIDLPPNMVLPKVFCAAVAAVKAKLEGFGMTWNNNTGRPSSVTFYFEGGAWIKSQCYADEWPNTDPLWWAANYADVPEGLFDAIDTVADFHPNQHVTFVDNAVRSHRDPEHGASYDVKGLQGGKQFAGKLMGQVAPWCSRVDLTTYPDRVFFVGGEQGKPVRGIVMCIRENSHEAVEPPPQPQPEPQPEAAPGPFVPQDTQQYTDPATMQTSGTPDPSQTGPTAQTSAYHSEPEGFGGGGASGGWQEPAAPAEPEAQGGGWTSAAQWGSPAIDDDVAMPSE